MATKIQIKYFNGSSYETLYPEINLSNNDYTKIPEYNIPYTIPRKEFIRYTGTGEEELTLNIDFSDLYFVIGGSSTWGISYGFKYSGTIIEMYYFELFPFNGAMKQRFTPWKFEFYPGSNKILVLPNWSSNKAGLIECNTSSITGKIDSGYNSIIAYNDNGCGYDFLFIS